ncbi:MAG: redox-regulated ATPase YchF [Spirochaetia bacterium]
MALNCGIVGLPNVGKSTIFSSLSNAPAQAANYPFCTIEPNHGIVSVPDERLDRIHTMIPADKKISATIEFVDIAGLVEGASKGEGLGNKFLANIRQTGMIAHVVRCFEDDDVIHVAGKVDPIRDIEIITLELILADMETLENRINKNQKLLRNPDKKVADKAKHEIPALQRIKAHLESGKVARTLELSEEDLVLIAELFLITMKKEILVCNVDEAGIKEENALVKTVRDYAKNHDLPVIVLCGKLEAEISQLETLEDRTMFLEEAGISVTGLEQLAKASYHMLGLRTFFTVGGSENRAWTFKDGDTAPRAAGYIHTDFEKGFIRAEAYNCEDLFVLKNEAEIKAKGKLRQEGKDYLVKDGDVLFFKFNN